MSDRPSWFARAAVALWIAAQAVMLARVALPLERPWGGGHVPWRMFTTISRTESTIVAEGTTTAGEVVAIPLERWFRFTRGSTGQRVLDLSPILMSPGHREERAAFARWLAARMAEEGVRLREVRLIRRDRDLYTDAVRERRIGRFEVGDGPA